MSVDWTDAMSSAERREWDRFVAHARESTVHMIASSAFVASLVPDGEPDIKFAVELGLAIMLGKPVVAIAVGGRTVPEGLRNVACGVIEVSDIDTESGAAELAAKLRPLLDEFGAGAA